jgi:hypothetical protein
MIVDPIPALQKTGAVNSLTVSILDSAGEPAVNYRGAISFSSNFGDSLPATYTFTAADAGVHTFNITLNGVGTHQILVRETRFQGQVVALNPVIHNGTLTTLPITNAREMILDGPRGMLYFSTSAGTIERFNLSTQAMLLPISAGTTLNGLDVTPDGNFIYAAEGIAGATQGLIRKINVNTGAVTTLPYTYASNDGLAWDVATTANGLAFFTTTALTGVVPLRQINLATDAITLRADLPQVGQSAILDRTFDHGSVLLQSTASPPVAAYSATTDAWNLSTTNTNTARSSGALSRDGALAATNISGQTRILSTASGMPWIKQLAGIDGGIAFDPKRDVFYGVNSTTDEIIAYNTSTWLEKYRFPIGQNVTSSVAMGAGQLAINDEATLLFLSTSTGIRVFGIPQPTGVASQFLVSDFPKFVKK